MEAHLSIPMDTPKVPQLVPPEPTLSPGELRTAICEKTVEHCLALFTTGVKAILLAGSMARDEATLIREGGCWKVLGDAEFLLILEGAAALPSANDLAAVRARIKSGLLANGIVCPISLDAAHEDYLSQMRPHIFGYELRTRGRVVWGDPNTLNLIPDFQPRDIPLEDAWRLLNNRIVEQVEMASALDEETPSSSRALHYHTMKLYLDVATSYMLFAGSYVPTYRLRSEVLNFLAEWQSPDVPAPFPLAEFARNVRRCTEWKVGASVTVVSEGRQFWESAIAYAWLLWRWELAQLTQSQLSSSDHTLRLTWMKRQPLRARLRGWAYAVRGTGWIGSWRDWPRWLLRARYGSPRHWVYAAATELCFHLPWILESAKSKSEAEIDWRQILLWLPMTGEAASRPGKVSWQELAQAIAVNYHELMEKTCA